jgi:uncharacterized protein involved in oxidation of intracellular sulfur
MTRLLLILNDPPYGSERSYNALRLALNLLKQEPRPDVRIFLVGDAALCAKGHQKTPDGYYNIERMLKGVAAKGGTVGVCGSCMTARGIEDKELAKGSRRSNLDEMTEWTLWADKVLVF